MTTLPAWGSCPRRTRSRILSTRPATNPIASPTTTPDATFTPPLLAESPTRAHFALV